jgi:hypothetical protein
MCSREAKFSLSLHCFSAGVYILFQSLNIVFIASLQSPFVLCDSRALTRTCFNTCTMAPVITCDDCEEKVILIMCDVISGLNSDESISKVLESVKLEGCLNT